MSVMITSRVHYYYFRVSEQFGTMNTVDPEFDPKYTFCSFQDKNGSGDDARRHWWSDKLTEKTQFTSLSRRDNDLPVGAQSIRDVKRTWKPRRGEESSRGGDDDSSLLTGFHGDSRRFLRANCPVGCERQIPAPEKRETLSATSSGGSLVRLAARARGDLLGSSPFISPRRSHPKGITFPLGSCLSGTNSRNSSPLLPNGDFFPHQNPYLCLGVLPPFPPPRALNLRAAPLLGMHRTSLSP